MSATAKVYRYSKKTGELRPSRMKWEGEFPADRDGFSKNGYRKVQTLGDKYGLECDVYSNDKGWIILITAFMDYVASIHVTDPMVYLETIGDLSETCKSVATAMALAEAEE